MASRPHETLEYFDKYDYPLTISEIKFWSGAKGSFPLRAKRVRDAIPSDGKYYFLPGRAHIVKLRQQREKISHNKWQIAQKVGEKLKKIPTIAAIFVTGSLAMNNVTDQDDIDLMIVTYPNTLWITRLFLNLYLSSIRRHPGQTTAPDKICPNLWLDTNHLFIPDHSLRTAHEILQAKIVWDKGGVAYQFLEQNKWVKQFLPHAYNFQFSIFNFQSNSNFKFQILNFLLYPLNSILFALQYVYMLPKKTTERVSLGFAFFHPRD